MEEPKRTMTREELHQLVWSTPMQKLAEIYGLSDRGLAKTCQRHLVPVPGRGYWAKIEAGHRVRKTPLRSVQNPAIHTVHIGARVATPQSTYLAELLAAAKFEMKLEDDEIRKSRANLDLPEPEPLRPMPASISPAGIHTNVKPLLADLRQIDADRDGFIDRGSIKVAPTDVNRLVNFVSALAYELEQYDFEFEADARSISFSKDASSVSLRITAPRKRENERGSWGAYRYHHVGRLTFEIFGLPTGSRKHWTDTENRKIEQASNEIVQAFRIAFVAQRERDEKRRVQELKRAHLAHRRSLAALRQKRESDRLSFLHSVAAARREVDELRATMAAVAKNSILPDDYQRMMEWAARRLADLEEETSVERIQERLVEQQLYTDPDHLFDPEGEPPPKQGYWDD